MNVNLNEPECRLERLGLIIFRMYGGGEHLCLEGDLDIQLVEELRSEFAREQRVRELVKLLSGFLSHRNARVSARKLQKELFLEDNH